MSPPAAKKRRTDSDSHHATATQSPFHDPDHQNGAGNKIEEELATALGEGIVGAMHVPDENGHNPTGNDSNDTSAHHDHTSNVESLVTDIMDHTERQEQTVATGTQEAPAHGEFPGARGVAFLKANSHLKIQSLPILENLSMQILSFLSQNSYQDLTTIIHEPESEDGQAYATMRSLFDHTKRIYSIKNSFLKPSDLEITDSAQLDVIRKTNLASFVSSIFGSQEIGFAELNENFLDVFVSEGGRLLKGPGALYLELKTQAFIAAMNNKSIARNDLLFELFPEDMEKQLLANRPGNRQLAPSEIDFLTRFSKRREHLLKDLDSEDTIKALPDKYQWEHFLRDLGLYISKNYESINTPHVSTAVPYERITANDFQGKKLTKRRASSPNDDEPETPSTTHQGQFSVNQPMKVPVDQNMHGDIVARAARAARLALQGDGLRRSQQQSQLQHQHQQPQAQNQTQPQTQPSPSPSHQRQSSQTQPHVLPQQQSTQSDNQFFQSYTPAQQPQQQYNQQPAVQQYQHSPTPPGGYQQHSPLPTATPTFQQYNPNAAHSIQARQNGISTNFYYPPEHPHVSQTQPTQVLYERARMAASAKSSPASRKSGLPSQRRPWTMEEESALMAGLDRVKGPHWSQILAMFGPGGVISEALKDRNQVQLKDKARNLKLFFLKSGIEVPYYLKFVTGELKTRAPAQAAKREARERQKKQGEEDKAHVEGIKGMMALAGAHSSPVGGHEMSASPSLPPDPNSQAMFDQTAEQNLMQTLTQEVHGSPYQQQQQQQQHHHGHANDHIDPSMQLG